MNDDSMLDDDLKRLLQVMADPCNGGKLTSRERRAITQALNEIHGWREKNWHVARDTVSPGPDVARLLDAARKLEGPIRNTLLHSKPGYVPGTWMFHEHLAEFVAAIAEHEAAQSSRSAQS